MATLPKHFPLFLFLGLPIRCQSSVIYTPWFDSLSGISCDETSIYARVEWISLGSKAWYIDTNGAEETNDWYSNFDISCSLNSSWGLHPSLTSTLSVTINATNPSGDLIVSFSENDAKWFSVFLDLENYTNNRIYPSCVDNPDDDVVVMCTTSGIAEGNINDVLLEEFVSNRSNLFGGYPYRWLETLNPNDCSLEMPVTITLTNNPEMNYFLVTLGDDECSASYLYHIYLGDMFIGDLGLDVYLSMNSPYDIPIIIQSLEFEYNVSEPTNEPSISPTPITFMPTNQPSLSPTTPSSTNNPTSPPTAIADNLPIGEASATASAAPTNEPSAEPTVNPTVNPTNAPTYSPTDSPSVKTYPPSLPLTMSPSMSPTTFPSAATNESTVYSGNSPSSEPSQNPSVNPSYPPTVISNAMSITSNPPSSESTDEVSAALSSSGTSSNELTAVLLAANIIVLLVIGYGIMHYLRRKTSISTSEKVADEKDTHETETEEQIEGAGQNVDENHNEGRAGVHLSVQSFETDDGIVYADNQRTDQGDV